MKKMIAFFLVAFTVLACEESIKNGIIPEKYLSQAKALEGTYKGSFDGRQVTLTFSIQNDGYALLTATDKHGNNELVRNCEEPIGRLVSIDGDSQTKQLEMARFDFKGFRCNLAGQSLEVHINSANELELFLAERSHIQYTPGHCTGNGEYYHCTPGQQHEVIDSWLEGTFVRQ